MASRRRAATAHTVRLTEEPVHDGGIRISVECPDGCARGHASYLLARVERGGGCWLWKGPVDRGGYGVANLAGCKPVRAHRAVYQLLVGPIPEGMHLDHQCHNMDPGCTARSECLHRRCVNPDHLKPATPAENTRRGKTVTAQNSAKTACSRGHPYDRVGTHGDRRCRRCDTRSGRLRRERRRVEAAARLAADLWSPQPEHNDTVRKMARAAAAGHLGGT